MVKKKNKNDMEVGEVRYTASDRKVVYHGFDRYLKKHKLTIDGEMHQYSDDTLKNFVLFKRKP